MPKPFPEKKDIPPVLPQKPGSVEIDVDDAMIEAPKDDVFKKEGEDKKDGGNRARKREH